jgi:hypothetical protein
MWRRAGFCRKQSIALKKRGETNATETGPTPPEKAAPI